MKAFSMSHESIPMKGGTFFLPNPNLIYGFWLQTKIAENKKNNNPNLDIRFKKTVESVDQMTQIVIVSDD